MPIRWLRHLRKQQGFGVSSCRTRRLGGSDGGRLGAQPRIFRWPGCRSCPVFAFRPPWVGAPADDSVATREAEFDSGADASRSGVRSPGRRPTILGGGGPDRLGTGFGLRLGRCGRFGGARAVRRGTFRSPRRRRSRLADRLDRVDRKRCGAGAGCLLNFFLVAIRPMPLLAFVLERCASQIVERENAISCGVPANSPGFNSIVSIDNSGTMQHVRWVYEWASTVNGTVSGPSRFDHGPDTIMRIQIGQTVILPGAGSDWSRCRPGTYCPSSVRT